MIGIAIKGLSAASLPNDLTADQARWAKDMIKYLDDVSAPPAEVRLCLDALDEHGLKPFNYPYYYLNLLSAIGDHKSPAHVRDLAIACVKFRLWRQWQSHSDAIELHAKRIAGERLPVRLKGWDKPCLDSILGNGRGMIVCTCHYGASCYILDDLTTFGYDIVIGLDANSAFGFRKRLQLLGHMSANGEEAVPVGNGSVRIVDVENNGFAAVALAKALRKNQVVLLYFDGNSGLDGARGNSNKCTLECFGYPVQVKSGAAQLAISTKAPLVPIFSLQTHSVLDPGQPSERGVVRISQPIVPDAAASQDKESFAQHALEFLFHRLEGLVAENPDQWEGACLFHRWRVAPARAGEHKSDLNAMNALSEGRRLRINDRLIATIPSSDGFMLVNVRTLRVFKVKRKHDWVLSTLASEGVDQDMLHTRCGDYPAAIGCIKDLSDLGFIEHCD